MLIIKNNSYLKMLYCTNTPTSSNRR